MAEAETLPVETAEAPPEAIHPDQPVSTDIDGIILTGVGETEESLREGIAPAIKPERKVTRGQKRFDELTGEREAAKREAEAAKQEAAALKARLEALEQAQQARPAAEPSPAAEPPKPPAVAQPARPKPTVEQVGSTYQSYEDFLEDLADWKAEQRLAAIDLDAQIRRSIEADRASRTFQEHVSASDKKAREVYTDFDAVLTAPHMTANNWPIDKIRAIAELDEPYHVQYALGKDPALADRLRLEADPVKFGMLIAKLIPSPAVASSPASTAGTVVALPPPPMQPVGSGSKTTVLSAADLAERGGEDYDSSGFREQARRERGRFR